MNIIRGMFCFIKTSDAELATIQEHLFSKLIEQALKLKLKSIFMGGRS